MKFEHFGGAGIFIILLKVVMALCPPDWKVCLARPRSRQRKIFRAARPGVQNSKNCFRRAKFLPEARAK